MLCDQGPSCIGAPSYTYRDKTVYPSLLLLLVGRVRGNRFRPSFFGAPFLLLLGSTLLYRSYDCACMCRIR